MLKRIITALILVLIFVPVCIFSHTIIFPIFISLLSLIAVYEISKCLGYHKNLFLTIPLYLIALALPIFRCFVNTNAFFLSHIPAVFVGAVIYALIYVMLRKNKDNLNDLSFILKSIDSEQYNESTKNLLAFFIPFYFTRLRAECQGCGRIFLSFYGVFFLPQGKFRQQAKPKPNDCRGEKKCECGKKHR